MYDYASSEPKIRHGSKARASYADEAEARFAIVTCSALISYLRTKADEAGIDYCRHPKINMSFERRRQEQEKQEQVYLAGIAITRRLNPPLPPIISYCV